MDLEISSAPVAILSRPQCINCGKEFWMLFLALSLERSYMGDNVSRFLSLNEEKENLISH